ncbi:MAG: isopentenyl-diphosphate Delta-isomerase [Chitinophagaceae bacterium]
MSEVVLVNERDEEIGTMEKMAAHRYAHLHRAFSVFIFNSRGEMLLQQRSREKYHSGGLWTNACCSHPLPGEDILEAAGRRLMEEMGFKTRLKKIFHFTYKSEFDNGLTEYEFDHVFTGVYEGMIRPDRSELQNYRYLDLESINAGLEDDPGAYTAWFHIAFPLVAKWAGQQWGNIIDLPMADT